MHLQMKRQTKVRDLTLKFIKNRLLILARDHSPIFKNTGLVLANI